MVAIPARIQYAERLKNGKRAMTDALIQAHQRREHLLQELAMLDKYIDLHLRLFGGVTVEATGNASATSSGNAVGVAKSDKVNDPKAIANGIEAILRGADLPVRRGKLITRLAENGIPIHSQDKSKYIGTILWRNSDRFVNIEGRGYWLTDRPVPLLYPANESMFDQDS